MLFSRSLIVLASLAAFSNAAPASSSTSTRCWTTMGSSSVRNCPTRWTTTTLSCTSTSTVVLTKSSTPQAQTSTVTKTTVITKTESASVSTAISTLLSTVTTTLASSTTSTYLSTSVISTASTTTVSSSADFVPVQSSFPSASYDGNPNPSGSGSQRRDESQLTSPIEERGDNLDKRNNYHPGRYPQSVSCRAYPSGKCTTMTTTSTTTVVVPSPTTYTTVTITKTVTSNPSATTTTTVSSTLTSTVNAITTFISVGTTTTTSYTSIATIFAACGSDNVVDKYMGFPIDGLSDYTGQANPFDLAYSVTTAVSYQDCCGQAYIDTNGPLAWLYGASQCLILESQGEATVQSQNKLTATYGDGTQGQFLIGNGRFGEWTGAASDGTV